VSQTGCAGNDRDEQEVRGRATDADDAAADADESTARITHRAHQQQRHLRQPTENIPVSSLLLSYYCLVYNGCYLRRRKEVMLYLCLFICLFVCLSARVLKMLQTDCGEISEWVGRGQ